MSRRSTVQVADVQAEPAYRMRPGPTRRLASRRRPHRSLRSDAQGERVDRRHRHLPPGGSPVHRQADRAGDELRCTRRSSRSRIPACSTSCASALTISPRRWSSRRRPRRCWASSPVRPASWSPCSRPCWRTRFASARPTSASCFALREGAFRAAAMLGVPAPFAEYWQRGPQNPGPKTALGRARETKQTVHIIDVTKDPAYVEGEPVFVAAVNLGRFRTILNVPMLKENELIGVIRHLPPGGPRRSPTSRSSWSRTSPTRR